MVNKNIIHIYSMAKVKKAELVKFRYKAERLCWFATKETDKYYYGTVNQYIQV